MELLFSLLGGFLGIILVLSIISFFLYKKIKAFFYDLGYKNMAEIKNMIKEGEASSRSRIKSISGMTSILLPKIRDDFPDFNEGELYNGVEVALKAIFNGYESYELSSVNELKFIAPRIREEICDLKSQGIKRVYDDVVFHNHAIYKYIRENGVYRIVVNSSLEYYYREEKNGKVIGREKDYKMQTSYQTEFIYIYDMDLIGDEKYFLGLHCPNCGAPISIKNQKCSYCSSNLDDINLKSWFVSSYKEK